MRKQQGTIAVLTLFVLFILVVAGTTAALSSLQSIRHSSQNSRSWVALQVAEAGIELETAKAFLGLSTSAGRYIQASYDRSSYCSDFAPGVQLTTQISPMANPKWAYITSTATYQGVSRSVRMLVKSKDVGIWNNAIFAGTGAVGQAINGNVDIRGSVHILGDGEAFTDLNGNGQRDVAETFTDSNHNGVWDPGEPFVDANGDGVWNSAEPYNDTNHNGVYDPPLTQTDLNSTFSGNGYIGNNYSGMPVALESVVPPPPLVNNIETLSAELRCKHGRVGLSGTATVGTNSVVDGGTSKNTLDGTFVSDGWSGNKGSASVYSDNGSANGYDLGAMGIDFPLLSGIGADSYRDSTGQNWADQETFLNSRSLTIPVSTIKSTTAAFTYGPDQYGNKVVFTPQAGATPAKLTVTGIVKVVGNLQLGAKDTIRFDGCGTIYATGDLNIDGNILPVAGKTFPTQTTIGFIAKGNMGLATGNGSSQLSMCGAYYAQGRITSRKQNQIAGTFVSNFFDMGTNVPNIYQVPELPNYMPPGMPGDQRVFTVTTMSWRRRQ